MNERGFTLIELIVASTVAALLGVALVQLLVNDSRFVARQDAMMEARMVSRAAINVLSELRTVSRGGLRAASADSVTVRVPYAFGMACGGSGSSIVASLVPSDSLIYAQAVPGGVASRRPGDTYAYVLGISVAASSDTASCTADSIRVLPGGRLVQISGLSGPPTNRPQSGDIIYLFQTVTYTFAPSAELPGRRALWRRVGGASAEEIVTPFDPAARFAFLTGPTLQVTLAPPAVLDSVRGLELRLVGESERWASGDTPERFELITRLVFFNNGF